MWKANGWAERMEKAALGPEDAVYQTIVEIAGDRRVLIENHRGIMAYGSEQIRVNVKYGWICICGDNLEILHMSKEQLVIFGKIQSVILHRREQP